jgi:hypothetical protein
MEELSEVVQAIEYNHNRWGDPVPSQLDQLERIGAITQEERQQLVPLLTEPKNRRVS